MQDASQEALFETYRSLILGEKLSAVRRGHGSAFFLEFGALSPTLMHNRSTGHARGAYSIMIEWSWRIEQENTILCGSWSDESQWERHFASLIGLTIKDVSLFGRLPELYITLSENFHVASFMTADGQPCWTIFLNGNDVHRLRWLTVENGSICEQEERVE